MTKTFMAAAIFALSFAIPIPAFADAMPPGYEQLGFAYRQMGAALEQLIKIKQDEIDVLKKHDMDMDLYLKACADHPGCTVPVPPK